MISMLVNLRFTRLLLWFSSSKEADLTEFHAMPGHLIRRLHQISTSVFAERMEQHGFDFTPIQFAALSGICETPGIDQAGLAGSIACDRVTTGGVLDRLENKGLVERRVSERDRRARLVFATDAGRKLLQRVRPVVQKLQADILVGLDAEEAKLLIQLLYKVTDEGNLLSRAPLKKNTSEYSENA